MNRQSPGRYEWVSAGGEEIAAFIPAPLPPANPPLIVEGRIADRLRYAEQALTRLDLAGEMVPSLDWFIFRTQGGGLILSDRRHTGDPDRLAHLRG